MDVRGIDTGPPGAHFSSAPSGLAVPKAQVLGEGPGRTGDTIADVLRQFSEPEVVKFLESILFPRSPVDAARLEDLLHASVSAAADGNAQRALLQLSELAALDPRRAETLTQEPGLNSIRPQVEQLLSRLTSAAHLNAESKLAEATRLLEAQSAAEVPSGLRHESAVLIADRLLEAGGYANYVRSAEVSQMSINQYAFAQTPAPLRLAEAMSVAASFQSSGLRSRHQWLPRTKMLWLRAPLLVLLLAWLVLGFVAGSITAMLRVFWPPQTWPADLVSLGFEVWGLGFVALIAFGFYTRVRNMRR